MSDMYPSRSKRKGNANNFKKTEKVQVRYGEDAEWEDYTKPCGSKQIIFMTLIAEKLFGRENVRWVKVTK